MPITKPWQQYPITKHDDLFRFIETNFTRERCLDCGAISIDGEHSADHSIVTEIRITQSEWDKMKQDFRTWENNYECPICDAPTNPKIRSAETGLNYCSDEHTNQDVKAKTPPEGW